MRKSFIACAALALLAQPAPAHAQEGLARARILHQRLADRNACPVALPEAQTFRQGADYRALTTAQQIAFLGALGACAWRVGDADAVFEAAREAGALGASWAEAARIDAGARFNRPAEVLAAFADLEAAPDRVRNLAPRHVGAVLRAARTSDPTGAAALRVYDVLLRHENVYAQQEFARVDHARLMLIAGDVAGARQRIGAVTDPRIVLSIRIDRTFDPLRADPAFERSLDLRVAQEAHVREAREIMARTPRQLTPVLMLAQALRALGRSREALTEIDRVLTRAEAPEGPTQFDDHDAQLNWLLNERAYALYDLNRADEARDTLRRAALSHEGAGINVSQAINYASMLVAEGRPQEALTALTLVGDASPYGNMWSASVRACAAEQLGDAAQRDEALAFLRAHEADNPAALARGLLCVNDLDGAAALYIRRLANPELREDALLALQIYRAYARTPLTFDALLDQRLAIVRNRPDVRAAAEAVGRIEEAPLYPVYWGSR